MGTLTTNYRFNKPTLGGDTDNWGDDYSTGDPLVDDSPGLNGNWEKLDQLLQQQADTIAALQTALDDLDEERKIKVGDLYVSTDADDPATKLGYGTWAAWGEGRALVGVGNAGAGTRVANAQFGNDVHTLTGGEMPAHTHGSGSYATNTTGNHRHTISGVAKVDGGSFYANRWTDGSGTEYTDYAGDHSHTVNGTSGSSGSGNAHNNAQYSKAAYIWKRTA